MSGSLTPLTTAETSLLGLLGIFSGSFTREAAQTVVAASQADPGDLDAALTALEQKGYVQRAAEADGASRLTLGETAHQQAQQLLGSDPAEQRARAAHAAYYLTLVQKYAPQLLGPQKAAVRGQFEREYPDIAAALRWALEAGQTETALRLGGLLAPFWATTPRRDEGRALLGQALAQPHDGLPPAARALGLRGAATLAADAGDLAGAAALFEQSLAIYRTLDDKPALAAVLNSLGMTKADLGDHTDALELFEELRSLRQSSGDRQGTLGALNALALINLRRGDYAQSQAIYEQALVLGRELNIKPAVAMFLNNLGYVMGKQGQYEQATAVIEESLGVYESISSRKGVSEGLGNLADIKLLQGDTTAASELASRSLQLSQEINNVENVADALETIAGIGRSQGNFERAAQLLGAADAVREGNGTPVPPSKRGPYQELLAQVRASLGDGAFEAAWQAGRQLSRDQAVSYGLAAE